MYCVVCNLCLDLSIVTFGIASCIFARATYRHLIVMSSGDEIPTHAIVRMATQYGQL